MKINSTLLLLLAATGAISACKKEHEPDYSNCQLYKVQYTSGSSEYNKPYRYGNVSFEYDNENRYIKQIWESSSATFRYEPNKIVKTSSFFGDSTVYVKDNSGRIQYHIDYPSKDSTTYDYDGEGYLIGKNYFSHIYGPKVWIDYKYSYNNGNLVQEVSTMYNVLGPGSDTLTYTYDNTPYFPESQYLYQTPNFLTGRPNRNNITDVRLKAFALSLNPLYKFPYIHYSYLVKGNRLEKVIMDLDPEDAFLQGKDTMSVSFTYKCN